MSKFDRVRDSFGRGHADLFSDTRYEAEFFNYSGGSYDPDKGEIVNEGRVSIGTKNVEIVPPAMDTTVRQDGTSFSFDTSIRFPIETNNLTVADGESVTISAGDTDEYATVTVESGGTLTVDGTLIVYDTLTDNGTVDVNGTLTILNASNFTSALDTLGEDNERPTEVEISDEVDNSTETFELHGYSFEKGSGMVMCRLVEQ